MQELAMVGVIAVIVSLGLWALKNSHLKLKVDVEIEPGKNLDGKGQDRASAPNENRPEKGYAGAALAWLSSAVNFLIGLTQG